MQGKLNKLFLIFAAFALAILPPALPTHAEADLKVIDNKAVIEYPGYIYFELELEGPVKVVDVRLNYCVGRDSFVDVVCEAVADIGDDALSASWKWDMATTGNLPPGSVVTYWWKITTADGVSCETQPKDVTFDDYRYQWQRQNISEGSLTLFWYRGNHQFALELMDAAQEALKQLEADMGALLVRPVKIYIYGNSSDLQGAVLYAQEWTGGLAFTGYGVVAIGVAPSNLEWGKRAVVHELAHLVTHQMTYNPYNSIPVWLNEGISMHAEGKMDEIYEASLKRALLANELISVKSLSSPFSTDADIAHLSYAQSQSLVEYLINEYGSQKMEELLAVFRRGCTYDEGFLEVYGFDTKALDDSWQDYIKQQYGISAPREMNVIPLCLNSSLVIVAILVAAGVMRRKRQAV